MAAVVPMDVPAIIRVKGMIATTRMMKGMERSAFTTSPSAALTAGADRSSPRFEVARNTPSGRPRTVPIRPETTTM